MDATVLDEALRDFHARTTRLLDQLLRERGTSITRITVLTNVARHGPLNLTDLATVCGYPRRTASMAADRLVMEELLRRDPGSRDRRIRRITITEAGLTALRASEPIRARLMTDLFSPLSDSERLRLTEIIARLQSSLSGLTDESL